MGSSTATSSCERTTVGSREGRARGEGGRRDAPCPRSTWPAAARSPSSAARRRGPAGRARDSRARADGFGRRDAAARGVLVAEGGLDRLGVAAPDGLLAGLHRQAVEEDLVGGEVEPLDGLVVLDVVADRDDQALRVGEAAVALGVRAGDADPALDAVAGDEDAGPGLEEALAPLGGGVEEVEADLEDLDAVVHGRGADLLALLGQVRVDGDVALVVDPELLADVVPAERDEVAGDGVGEARQGHGVDVQADARVDVVRVLGLQDDVVPCADGEAPADVAELLRELAAGGGARAVAGAAVDREARARAPSPSWPRSPPRSWCRRTGTGPTRAAGSPPSPSSRAYADVGSEAFGRTRKTDRSHSCWMYSLRRLSSRSRSVSRGMVSRSSFSRPMRQFAPEGRGSASRFSLRRRAMSLQIAR